MNQPYLHDSSVVLAAPVQCWADSSGQAPGGGIQGVYVGDERIASSLTWSVSGRTLEHIATHEPGGAVATYRSVVRTPELGTDPAITLTVERSVNAAGLADTLVLASAAEVPVPLDLQVVVVPDASAMEAVKQGAASGRSPEVDGLGWSWRDANTSAVLLPGEATASTDDGRITLAWSVVVPPRGRVSVTWRLDATDVATPFGATSRAALVAPTVEDAALRRLVTKSWADLNGLMMAPREHTDEAFLAAGAPWFFTLFGRDSLIAARLLVGLHPDLARTTLRTLARRQGVGVDVQTAEQPGKILHEVRRVPLTLHATHYGSDKTILTIPPVYFGTIDATLLWVMLLGDLFDAGQDVSEFSDALDAALGWLRDHADADGDGFLEYRDESGSGLANQGWKDSGDSIRFADGSQADAPIALAEVQGYAHAAALVGARILAARGDAAGSQWWTTWAGELAERFRSTFWVPDAVGRYPALALDAAKRPVDGCASNMGHLLGTGLLSDDEAREIVDRLVSGDMFSGYGIRTMSTTNAGYWPLSYHVGSVWTHDTAVCVDGMLREGFGPEARLVAQGLLRAASGFDDRLPELFGGWPTDEVWPPAPYPASCRPQAWAAASAAVVVRALG